MLNVRNISFFTSHLRLIALALLGSGTVLIRSGSLTSVIACCSFAVTRITNVARPVPGSPSRGPVPRYLLFSALRNST